MNKYKLINKQTNQQHLCDKVTIDGFDYYYIDELIPYNPNGGTNGNFICLSEIISNKDYGVKLGDKQYISPFVKNVGQCGGCRKLIATNNPNIDVPKVIDETWVLFKEIDGTSERGQYEHWLYKSGYNKSQETHPFSEEDMKSFGEFCAEYDYRCFGNKTQEEMLQIWKDQKPKIVYYEYR